jgi:opacity protein-like surface antigen
MANLTVKHTYYERYEPIMEYTLEMNGNTYNKGHESTYSVVEGVDVGLYRTVEALALAGIEGEAVTVSGVTLNAGSQQYLSDKFTNNKEVASITFA